MATLGLAARSIAYATSAAVTSRLTGGLKCTPWRMWTVTVLPPLVMPPFAVVGTTVARSGLTVSVVLGMYENNGRWVA